MVIILMLLPISLFSQYSMYNVNGWSYGGAWGITDTVNTGMMIEEGPTPDDSVMTFKNAGWASQPIGDYYVLQN